MALEIFAYGYGDILQNALNAIVTVVKSDNFKGMVKTAIALYIVWMFWRVTFNKFEADLVEILKKVTLMLLAVIAILDIKYTVIVTDKTKPALSGIVDNVPAVVALPLWFSNRAEYVITKTFETAFSLPDGVSYNTVGYAGGVKNLRDLAYYVKIDNAYLHQSLISYYKNCVFAALYSGKIGTEQVKRDTAENVIKTVATLEPSRTTVYYDESHKEGQTLTCQDAASKILTDISKDRDNVLDKVAKIMGMDSTTLTNYATGELSYFLGISGDAKSNLYELALLTVSKDALIQKAAEAGVDPNELGLTVASAREKLFLTNATLGDSIREFLPYLRVYLAVIFIAFAPILILVGLATGNVLRYASTAFFLAMFPVFWGGIGAVTNFIISHQLTYLKDIVDSAKYSNPTFNIEDYPYIISAVKEWLTIAGWAGSAVIILSLAIMTGSAYAFVRFAGGFVSGLAGAASGAAGGIAMGNISVGNVSTDNVSSNNTSTNKWSSASIFATGYQLSNVEAFDNTRRLTNENIYKDGVQRDVGATVSANGQPQRAAESLTTGYQHNAGVSQNAGNNQLFNTGKGTNKVYTYNKNWTVSETGNKSNAGDITRMLAEHARLNVTGLESLMAAMGQNYDHSISDRSTVGNSIKGSEEQTHQGTVEAGITAGAGTKSSGAGGTGLGRIGGGTPRKAGKSTKRSINPLISLLKAFGGNVQISGKDANISREDFTKAFDKAIQNADAQQVAEFLRYAKQHGVNLSSILDRSGQEALLSKLAYAFNQQAGVSEATGVSRSGQEFANLASQLSAGTNYQSNEQAFAGRNLAVTRDTLASLFTQNREMFDKLVEKARSFLSDTPFGAIGAQDYETYKRSLEAGNYATAFTYGSAVIQEALANPQFAEELRDALRYGRVNEIESEVSQHTDNIRGKIESNESNLNPQEVFNKEVQQRAENNLEDYRNRAEGIKHKVDKGYDEVKNKVSNNVEAEKGQVNAVKEQTDRAKDHLTQQFNNKAHKVNDKQQDIEQKANAPASPLKAGENLWNKSDFLGKGAVALATANAGMSAIKGAKKLKQVVEDIKNRTSKPNVTPEKKYSTGNRLSIGERAGRMASKAEELSERAATRVAEVAERALPSVETGMRILGKVAEPLAVAGLIAESIQNPPIKNIQSEKDVENLQPNQFGVIGSYLVQKLADDRYSVFTNDGIQEMNAQQVKELVNQYLSSELRNTNAEDNQGIVIVNQEKLEKTGSSVAIVDADKLNKLLSSDDEW